MKTKFVCIKDTVKRNNSKGEPYELRDPFLTIGKSYTSVYVGANVIMFDNGDKWLSYDRDMFVEQDVWRERQINKLI